METSIDPQIRFDLANETLRHHGEVQPDFPAKMARRLKRKFHSTVDTATILTLAHYFKEIYKSGASILRDFITTHGEYASLSDIKLDSFVTSLVEKYPHEDKAIIKAVCDWVIYYEYLR